MSKFFKLMSVLSLVLFLTVSCSAQRLFSDLSSVEGVTNVYVGKTMLAMVGTMDLGDDADEVADLIKDINSIEVVSSEDAKSSEQVRKSIDNVLKSYNSEIITEVNENENGTQEHTCIYSIIPSGDKKNMEGLLIVNQEGKELNVVFIRGKIDLEALMEKNAK